MIHTLLLPLLSGILYVFSFAPWNQGYLQWIAFAPLFFAVDELNRTRNLRALKVFLMGMILSLCICIGGFYWIVYATQQYGGLPLPAALAVFAVFCVFGQLQVPLYLILRKALLRLPLFATRPWHWFIAAGLSYAGIEATYPKLFLDTAGNAFSHSVYFRQIADIGGPFFLTALLITVAELIVVKRKRELIVAGLIIAASFGYGYGRVQQIHSLESQVAEDQKLKVSMIQANIGDFIKVAAERGATDATSVVMNQYMALSENAVNTEKPDVVLWPETAYPAIFDLPMSTSEKMMDDRMKEFGRYYQRLVPHGTFLFGGYDQDQSRLDYNSLFFYRTTEGMNKRVYRKAVLLMFGETLPFAEYFPAMKSWFPTMGFFGRGPGPQVLEVTNAAGHPFHLAPSICYEGLFTDHAVIGARLGADVLVNITNDSWFGKEGEPYLHLALTIFRSIETRLPMLRATNTGFTVLVDATGELVQSSKLFESEIITSKVGPRLQMVSPYLAMSNVFGPNWFVRFCQVIIIGCIALLILKRKSILE